jgi:hypothetical protein
MSRLRGFFRLGAALGALAGVMMAGEARAANDYRIVVSITDNTTHTTTVFTVNQTGPGSGNNTSSNPNSIIVGGGLDTSATGVTMSGITSVFSSGGSTATLTDSATAQVNSGSSDSYTITVTSSHNALTAPPGSPATLSQSESGTYSNTSPVATNTQLFQSWYDNTNTLGLMAGTSPGQQSFTMASTSGTLSGNANTPNSVGLPGYSQPGLPYALTETITINLQGTDVANNAKDVAGGTATITAVPEPASLVMLLTGMPVPLVVLGMLRRRKATAKS